MSAVEPQEAQQKPKVSKIPLSLAPEVLRRRDELEWSLRNIAGWLSDKLGQTISHRAVDRFIRSRERRAFLDAQRPFRELMMGDLEELREAIAEERRLADDTEEELARKQGKSPEQLKELEGDLARSDRKIRSLISQFNAYGKHVPKPDSSAVPVCTPDSSRFTRPELSSNPAAADRAQPPPGETSTPKPDSRAVPGCTPVSDAFTRPEAPSVPAAANRPEPAAEKPSASDPDSRVVPVCTPDSDGFTQPEAEPPEQPLNLDELKAMPEYADFFEERPLRYAMVYGTPVPRRFNDWILSLSGQPPEIDPSWISNHTSVMFFDVSQNGDAIDWALRMLSDRPEFEPRMVFVLPQNADRDLFRALPSNLNPPIRLPLTKEKVNAALESVERAKKEWKAPLRSSG